MNSEIMKLSNIAIYENSMTHGSEEIQNRVIKLKPREFELKWIQGALDPDRSAVFVNTDQITESVSVLKMASMKKRNFIESLLVFKLIDGLLEMSVDPDDICVITPYLE